jgi:hypothetical protein
VQDKIVKRATADLEARQIWRRGKSPFASSWKGLLGTHSTQPGWIFSRMKTTKTRTNDRGKEMILNLNLREIDWSDKKVNTFFSGKFRKFSDKFHINQIMLVFVFGQFPKISDKFQMCFRTNYFRTK